MKFREFLNKTSLLRWFGKSKVVDENGMPKTVYHGSPEPIFSKFSLSPKRSTNHEAGSIGIWFTDAPEVAGDFAKRTDTIYEPHPTDKWSDGSPKVYAKDVDVFGGIYPVYLKIENPVVYRGEDGFEEMMDDRDKFVEYISGAKGEKEKGYWRKRYIALNSAEANKAFVEYLKSNGHDGIIILNTKWDANPKGTQNNQYVIFDPKQAKSIYAKDFIDTEELGESIN